MGFAVKISGSGPIGSSSGVNRKRESRASGSSFRSELESHSAGGASSLAGMAPIATVGGLLSLQEAPDATMGRSKGLARAEDMLKDLETLQRGLVLGTISVQDLRSISAKVRGQRQSTQDSRLDEILAEIELRAEIELAKLGF